MCCEMPKMETVSNNLVRAAKDHKCCECGKLIMEGTEYWYYTAVYRHVNKWLAFKTCVMCELKRELYKSQNSDIPLDGEPAFGELHECIKRNG